MQRLMTEHKLTFSDIDRIDVRAVVIERASIGRGGLTPRRLPLDQRKAKHQGSEKRMVEDQARAGGGELGGNVTGHQSRMSATSVAHRENSGT